VNARSRALEIVEAIYREEKSERAWIDGILEAARPALDRGCGLVGFPFEANASGVFVSWVRVLGTSAGVSPALVKAVMATARDDVQVSQAYRATICATGSEHGLTLKPGFELLRRKGVHDALAINGFDTAGHGVYFGPLLARETALDSAFRARFSRVAAHLGVGLRYRRLAKATARAEAVFDPGAKLLHAEGAATTRTARSALKNAVVAIDRARGRQRRTDPDRALAAWQGLVDARWSLVDQFESDGKRYVVARENEPLAVPFAALSKRERQIVGYVALGHASKLIAYELGISHSTVRVLVHRAMRKLRVKGRRGLAEAFFTQVAASSRAEETR
jgi:DNA-binding CsgD family transcriptional regulator